MDKESKRYLEWTMRFTQCDLDKIEDKEWIVFMAEAYIYMSSIISGLPIANFDKRVKSIIKNLVEPDQENMVFKPGQEKKECLILFNRNSGAMGNDLKVAQIELRQRLELVTGRVELAKIQRGNDWPGVEPLNVPIEPKAVFNLSIANKTPKSNNADLVFSFYRSIGSNLSETLVFNFFKSLHDIPVDRIKRCKECNKWMFQPTASQKNYCSSNCDSRRFMRNKRAKQKPSEEERRKAVFRSKKYRERKIKEKYPNAKINHRPSKYNKEE